MEANSIQVGSYVMSKQGRDCNKISIIYKILNDSYVLLIDGKGKKISKPKLKKIKHLQNLNEVNSKLAEKISAGLKIFDAEVYSAISKFNMPIKNIEGGSSNV